MVFFKMGDEEESPDADAIRDTTEEKTKKKTRRKRKPRKKTAHGKTREHKPRHKKGGGIKVTKEVAAGALIIVVVAVAFMYSSQQQKTDTTPEAPQTTTPTTPKNPDLAEEYDIVTVDYVGRYLNDTVFDTSIGEIAEENNIVNPVRQYGPLTFTLGYGGLIPGFEEAVEGMKIGEENDVTIPPEKAFGYQSDELIQEIERKQASPMVQNVSMDKFMTDIGLEPYVGLEFTVPNRTAYELTWPMTVLTVYNDTITFRYERGDNTTIKTVFGNALVYNEEEEIIIEIHAEKGDEIVTLAGPAKIIDVNEENMTVDFNHPLAGKTLKFNIKLIGVVKQ